MTHVACTRLILLLVVLFPACKAQCPPPRQQVVDQQLRPEKSPPPAAINVKSIRLLSYNVLADGVHLSRRIPPLMELLRRSDAEIIALQEVAPWFLRRLARQPWYGRYHATRFDGRVAAPGGQMVLSRFPITRSSSHLLPGRQRRTVVIARVPINGRELAVATTHMESFLADGPLRARQLDLIFALLEGAQDAVLLGDFNFGDGEQPDTGHLDRRFSDLWQKLRPNEPGYTWDMQRSEMARLGAFPGEKSRRLDRILVRVKGFTPVSVRIIGQHAVPGGKPVVHPSDHFGLVGQLRRR